MIKTLYNSIKNYFSKPKINYQPQNPDWFTPKFLKNFKTSPKPKDSLVDYFEWAENLVR